MKGNSGSSSPLDRGAMASTAMAIAGRSARPCDVCGRDRARWYCAADEAYLCEPCDSSVHGANALASRHERVRLAPNGAPMKMDRHRKDEPLGSSAGEPAAAASAARQAINSKKRRVINNNNNSKDTQGFLHEATNPFCNLSSHEQAQLQQAFDVKLERSNPEDAQIYFDELPVDCSRSPCGSPSGRIEADYAYEFMVFDECDEKEALISPGGNMHTHESAAGGMNTSAGDFHPISYATAGAEDPKTPTGLEQKEEKITPEISQPETNTGSDNSGLIESVKEEDQSPGPALRLNYADVLNAWSERGSVWTGGPAGAQMVPEASNSDASINPDHGVVPMLGGEDGNSAREARMNRYREKRQNRLFSKKIRYEVRKLNAERRPRMKVDVISFLYYPPYSKQSPFLLIFLELQL
ncbi:hypothetical protein R1sor_012346 [Riccia sorocarpa]|uniref:Uncharacterized protein n=1 Tax=Riccia sorocarpa TaxID=122646 RepID=A0ABD3I7A6_9MARC